MSGEVNPWCLRQLWSFFDWLAAARHKFSLKEGLLLILMAAVNLQHPGPGERERIIFKGFSLHLPLSFFQVLSFLQEKVSGVSPCLLWSASTCRGHVWKVYKNIQKEMKMLFVFLRR